MARKTWYVGWCHELRHDRAGDVIACRDVECAAASNMAVARAYAESQGLMDISGVKCDSFQVCVEEVMS